MLFRAILNFRLLITGLLQNSEGLTYNGAKLFNMLPPQNRGNQRPKHLQNCDEKLDMGKHPFILVTN